MDCHKNFSRVTARDGQGKVLWRQRLEHRDRTVMRQQLQKWPKVPVVLEGTFGWGWISDELSQAGQEPHLSSSRKVAGWREARGIAKNNKLDADLLSELWTETKRWWEVWLAPREVRDQREWLRYRTTLVRMQTGIKNRIHATLHRHGIFFDESDLFGQAGLKLLEALIESDDPTLHQSTRKTLEGYLALLRTLRQHIAEVTRQLRRQVRKSVEGELWRSLPGISWVLAYTIAAEVGQIKRFKSNQNLASYSLLAAIASDSGDEDDAAPIGRHVGHIGRVALKWAFIAAARNAVRKDPQFKAVFDRRTDSGKRDKGRGYIAVARHLCRVGFSCVSKQRPYSTQRPIRPGTAAPATTAEEKDQDSLKEKNNALTDDVCVSSVCTNDPTSRPGMGQSDRGLVAAGT
jgi:transposase